MSSPRSVKDIQKLTGWIVALNRFIFRSVDKCLPFFKLLKNSTRFVWDDQCEEAFTNLKAYLSSPPFLVSAEPGEKLHFYLAASEETLADVLIKKTSKGQLPIYYISKSLHDSELNYSRIEKLAYSLLMASQKLKQYFQSHHITVLIDQPLKEVLQRMTTFDWMIKWSIKLSEYGLEFWPKKSIKAQTFADFVAECTFQRPQKTERQSILVDSDQLVDVERKADILVNVC